MEKYRPRLALVVKKNVLKQTEGTIPALILIQVIFKSCFLCSIGPSVFLLNQCLSVYLMHCEADLTWSDGRFRQKASVPRCFTVSLLKLCSKSFLACASRLGLAR